MMKIKRIFTKLCLVFCLFTSSAGAYEGSFIINPIGLGFGVFNLKIEKFLKDKPGSFLMGVSFGRFGFYENFNGEFLEISLGYRRYVEDKRINTLFGEMGMGMILISGVIRDSYGYYDYSVSGFASMPYFSAGFRMGEKAFFEGSLGFGFMLSNISMGSYRAYIGGIFPLFNINVGVMF